MARIDRTDTARYETGFGAALQVCADRMGAEGTVSELLEFVADHGLVAALHSAINGRPLDRSQRTTLERFMARAQLEVDCIEAEMARGDA